MPQPPHHPKCSYSLEIADYTSSQLDASIACKIIAITLIDDTVKSIYRDFNTLYVRFNCTLHIYLLNMLYAHSTNLLHVYLVNMLHSHLINMLHDHLINMLHTHSATSLHTHLANMLHTHPASTSIPT